MSEHIQSELTSSAQMPPFDFEGINRSPDLPSDFLPYSNCALVANDAVVDHAIKNCPPISPRRRWRLEAYNQTHWIRIEYKYILLVWLCGNEWCITRRCVLPKEHRVDTLAFVLGDLPVCARTCEEAKRLAEFYHLTPPEAAGGLYWTKPYGG